MKYKLVKFKDGRYGARKGFFFYKFLDLRYPQNEPWFLEEAINMWCKGTEAEAKKAISIAVKTFDKGTPV